MSKEKDINYLDVYNVANKLKLNVSIKQMNQILDLYEEESNNDPTATWDLVVENIIYNLLTLKPMSKKLKFRLVKEKDQKGKIWYFTEEWDKSLDLWSLCTGTLSTDKEKAEQFFDDYLKSCQKPIKKTVLQTRSITVEKSER
jgi:DNA-binding transcriptional MerR regulator